jgi:hypothetical protein
MNKVGILSLLISLAALTLSVVTYAQADSRAESALRRREKALMDRIKPSVYKIYEDFGLKGVPTDPQTLDEALAPLVKLMEGLAK